MCSQFPQVAALGEAAADGAASGVADMSGIGEAAEQIYQAAIAEYASMADMHVWSAVLFALIGFCLVTGIEVAGKIISRRS